MPENDPDNHPTYSPTIEQQAALYGALAKAQGQFAPIIKDRNAKIQMKAGGEYSYRYADLASVIDAVRPALAAHGLAMFQLIDQGSDGSIMVGGVLAHEGGGRIESWMGWSVQGDIKSLASTITYLRRYVLTALLGVAAEDDDDAVQAPSGRPVSKAPPARSEAPPPRPKLEPGPKPPPAAKAPPKGAPEHHPDFAKAQGRFFARLSEIGVRYEDLAAYEEAHGRPRPSSLDMAGIKALLDRIGSDEGRADLDEWLGKVSEVTDD